MKKVLNHVNDLVSEMCNGIQLAHPTLEWLQRYNIIKKKDLPAGKVMLISGGGSGHEPAHAGFVGEGMLDAAVCGDIFASPSQVQVYQGIRAVAGDAGVLLVIKNYSGDMMNFKNAAALAEEDGIKVDYVRVDDDIAVEDSLYTVGRRGVAGTVLVHKIAGAAAAEGRSLTQVKAVAEKVAANVRSLGVALTSCTVPAKGTPTFQLGEDEIEYGVGIHGEPGIRREKTSSAEALAERMVKAILADLKMESGRVALLVNGFGATPLQELYVVNHSARKMLDGTGVQVARSFVGNYMTSIDMAGFSISILKLDDEMEKLLNAPASTPGFVVAGPEAATQYVAPQRHTEEGATAKAAPASLTLADKKAFSLADIQYLIDKMGDIIIENEVPFCDLDAHAGDGDFGMSVAKGFRALKAEWDVILKNESGDIGQFLAACSLVIMENCGGASGPIWGSAFRAAARQAGAVGSLSAKAFADVMQAAVSGIQATGERSFGRGAVVGDKTLIDALVPCADAWSSYVQGGGEDLLQGMQQGAEAAVKGAESTKDIVARMGRAGTVGERSLGYPDAGAHALGVIFTQLTEALK